MAMVTGDSAKPGEPGVRGDSTQFDGVLGISTASGKAGVAGVNETAGGNGIYGRGSANGLYGIHIGADGAGVVGASNQNDGVRGFSTSVAHSGVVGINETGGNGIYGRGKGNGVFGIHIGFDGAGVVGTSDQNDGVRGFSGSDAHSGIVGTNTAHGVGVLGVSTHGLAGKFEGDMEVTGDIRLTNADCAEDFDVVEAESVEPGMVMVLGDEGELRQSQQAYDKRVAGVISGAGGYKPGIVLDKQQSQSGRKPVALLGKVFCRVDARSGPIAVGDLLTTSDTPGHAMKASDQAQAFGAVIGKALRSLAEGQGLIPILIALQ